jgi:transcriptional regulator with XRE-family HTH domain
MRIETENSDETVLRELGSRLARTRLERNLSQEHLANEAGVAKSTVERLEAGREVKLTSFVRILRALGQLEDLDRLIPEPLPSPIERIRLQGRRRRRAARAGNRENAEEAVPWHWKAAGPEVGDAL